jgi:metal-responsive CopG/Arc/MetJ family transcriptional regulator
MPKKINDKKISWVSVNIPDTLMERVLNFVENHKEEGYGSFAEFIRQAVREKLDREYEKIDKQKKVEPVVLQQ